MRQRVTIKTGRDVPNRVYRSDGTLNKSIIGVIYLNVSDVMSIVQKRSAYYAKRREGQNGEVLIENIAITDDDTYMVGDFIKKAESNLFDFIGNYTHDLESAFEIMPGEMLLSNYTTASPLFNVYRENRDSDSIVVIPVKEGHYFNSIDDNYGVDIFTMPKIEIEPIGQLYAIWRYDYFNENVIKQLSNAIEEYIANYVLFEWAKLSLPNDAQTFLNNAESFKIEIINRLHSQKKVVNRPYRYF